MQNGHSNGATPAQGRQKVVLFTPVNAAGHLQSSLAVADKLRADYNYKCVFCIAGPPHTNIIEDHGHQLVVVEDSAPLYDFELDEHDELQGDEDQQGAADGRPRAAAKQQRKFEGALRWPQFIARRRHWFQKAGTEGAAEANARLIEEILDWSIANNPALEEAIERLGVRIDLVVADSSVLQPSTLRQQHARPWVRLFSPNPLTVLKSRLPGGLRAPPYEGQALYSREERARMRAEEPPTRWLALLDSWRAASERRARLLAGAFEKLAHHYRAHGCQVDFSGGAGAASVSSPHLNIYMFPQALDYDQEEDLFEYPARWMRCDSLVRNADGQQEIRERELWAARLSERRANFAHVVYFSLGSIASGDPQLMRRYIDFLDQDQEGRTLYIVSKGVNGDKVQLNARNMMGANFLPQTYLLQQADAAVIHGGNNSLTESLYYGKPVIVLPAFADQLDNAQRVEDLGMGRRLDLYKCTCDQLLGAIREMLTDKKLGAKMAAIGEQMRARDELGRVTRMLHELAEKGRLSEETIAKTGLKVN